MSAWDDWCAASRRFEALDQVTPRDVEELGECIRALFRAGDPKASFTYTTLYELVLRAILDDKVPELPATVRTALASYYVEPDHHTALGCCEDEDG